MRSSSFQQRGEAAKVRVVVPRTSPGAARGTNVDAAGTAPRHAALESALVKNLKKQVACLEMEVAVLKGASGKSSQRNSDVAAAKASTEEGSGANPCVVEGQLSSSSLRSGLSPAGVSHMDPFAMCSAAPKAAEKRLQSLRHVDTASLQFTAERLRLEKESVEAQLQYEMREGERMVKENARLNSELRASRGREEELQRLHQGALNALNTEEGRRRELEDKLRAAVVPAVEEGGTASIEDLVNEKEYYRVQTDRLRFAQQESLIRIEELERQLSVERIQTAAIEEKLCTTQQEVRRSQQADAARIATYKRLDASHAEVCALLRRAVEDCDTLHQQLRQRHTDPSSPSSSVSIGDTLRGLERISSCLKSRHAHGEGSNICSEKKSGGAFLVKVEGSVDNSHKPSPNASPLSVAAAPSSPPPPAAVVPPPPPPTAVVPPPPPPTAVVPPPPPPTAVVPPPPPPTAVVPPPPSDIVVPTAGSFTALSSGVPQRPLHDAIDDELESVERRIREEEAALLAYLNAR
ncbi:hypothetical protein DQ04_06961020 [Trypanosoma grayi]|uniref:hypothetical protein n=1 Tax=Trypanosoma grayi TaxID=71804 RepID=UPI0004F3F6F8|nr:hypothetical protein DQ04_06961020 [Trypanosoma grayi]KEG08538.1 hypothetical protein DQ04_06961020 [Trypanosoma grayi]